MNKNFRQIILCREGKCIDLYYRDHIELDNFDVLECETLKEAFLGG